MDYTTFKLHLQEILQNQVGEGVTVEIRSVPKNNGIVRDGLMLHEPGSPMTSTVYLEQIYENWKNSRRSLEELAGQILEAFRAQTPKLLEDTGFFTDFSRAREHIYVRLIHYEWNRKLLKIMPHQRVMDLALVCYYRMEGEELKGSTIPITDAHRAMWGISNEQLFSIARANTCCKLPVCFLDMHQVLQEMYAGTGQNVPPELLEPARVVPMYILTNTEKQFGACALFYPNVQKHISDYLGRSYFVLPSSIHEVILVPDSGQFSSKELRQMVMEINRTQVDPLEVLSDTVYYYDASGSGLEMKEF